MRTALADTNAQLHWFPFSYTWESYQLRKPAESHFLKKKNKILLEQFSIVVDSVGRRRNPRWSERRNKSDTRQFVWLREKISSATDSAGERAGNRKRFQLCSQSHEISDHSVRELSRDSRSSRKSSPIWGEKRKKSFFSAVVWKCSRALIWEWMTSVWYLDGGIVK